MRAGEQEFNSVKVCENRTAGAPVQVWFGTPLPALGNSGRNQPSNQPAITPLAMSDSRATDERTSESPALRRAIEEQWDERLGLATGEARIDPTHEAHEEAADVVEPGVRPHRPVSVVIDGRRYDAHRCRRYPDTVVFTG